MGRRRVEEFWCSTWGGGCDKYFLTYLRDDMSGRYTIECPNCKHHHFRFIENGIPGETRHDDRSGIREVIVGLKTTLRDTPYTDEPEFKRRQLRAYQGGV